MAAFRLIDSENGGTLIIETAGTGYAKTRRHISISVRYSAQM